MADRKHASNIALPSSMSLPCSASQMFQPHQTMPSIEAYLEAYQTLLGVGRDPTASALSTAFTGSYPLRQFSGLPMTSMPFVPPSYFTFPSFPMDMSPYGLMSPVMIPPFFTSLYCDPTSSGTTGSAAAAAAALGRASMTADYRDSAAAKFISSALFSMNEKDEGKSHTSADVKENTIGAKASSTASQPTMSGTASKEVVSSHSIPRTSSNKSSAAPTKQHHHLQTHRHSTPKTTQSSSSLSHGSRQGLQGVGNTSDKSKARPLTSFPAYSPEQDSVPIDFSSSAPGRASTVVPPADTDAAHKHGRSPSSEFVGALVPNRASVVVAPCTSERQATRPANGSHVLDTKQPAFRSSPSIKDLKPLEISQQTVKPHPSENKKPVDNGMTAINFSSTNYSKISPPSSSSSSSSSSPHAHASFNQQPLRLDANTLSLLKNVNRDSAPLVRQDSTPSGVSGIPSSPAHMYAGNMSRQQQPALVEAGADKVAQQVAQQTASNDNIRRRLSRSERKQKYENSISGPPLSAASVDLAQPAAPLAVTSSATLTVACGVASFSSTAGNTTTPGTPATAGTPTTAGVEEFRCSLCNYSGRSQHCLTKHMRAHDVAYKICQYCRRAFERPSDLLRHEERHRRRDVTGSSPLAGGALPTANSTSAALPLPAPTTASGVGDIAQTSSASCMTSVGRVDSYSGGSLDWTNLVAVGVGTGDNEIVLDFDNLPANQANSRPPPEPSKFRDVYSIMAGIVVAQSLAAINSGKPPTEPIIPVVNVTTLSAFHRSDDRVIDNIVIQSNPPTIASPISNDNKPQVDSCDISSEAITSSKLEFLRKLDLEKAGGDRTQCSSFVENSKASRLDVCFSDRKWETEANGRKRRRKGRPIKADVSLATITYKNMESALQTNDGPEIFSDNDDGIPNDEVLQRGKKELISTKKICLEAHLDTASDVVDLSASGHAQRVSNGLSTKVNRRDAIIGKLVVRSRMFQRRRASSSTMATRIGSNKVDSNGNALTSKPIGRRSRRFTCSMVEPNEKASNEAALVLQNA